MAGPRFTPQEVQKRREVVSDLYLKGQTMQKIAGQVGVSFQQVHSDLKTVRAMWRSNTITNYEESRNRELASCDLAEAGAWQGWERSIGKVVVTRQEVAKEPRTIVTTSHQAGDPRFLSIVLDAVRRRCEILGLNAPLEARISGRFSVDELREILEAGGEEMDKKPDPGLDPGMTVQ